MTWNRGLIQRSSTREISLKHDQSKATRPETPGRGSGARESLESTLPRMHWLDKSRSLLDLLGMWHGLVVRDPLLTRGRVCIRSAMIPVFPELHAMRAWGS